MENYSSNTEVFNWKNITTIFDKNWTLCLVLIDWVYNYKFVDEFLKRFDDFELYNNWQLNITVATWLTDNLHYYF